MANVKDDTRYMALMGEAALHLWAELPQPIQEKLFEHAVVIGHRRERDEREQLARYLHDHHARTQAAAGGAS
jgi:signal transduction histidine kinase